MKKIGSMIIILIFIVFLAWGLESFHADSQVRGKNLIRTSRVALVNHKYAHAENRLQQNANVNPEQWRTKRLLSQIQDYLSGNRYFKGNQLGLAMISYKKASRSRSVVLKKRSLHQIHQVDRIEYRAVHYNLDYNQAISDNHSGKFKRSDRELNSFIMSSSLHLNYFKTLRLLANRLRRANDDSAISNQVERSCFPELSLSVDKEVVHSSDYRLSTVRKEIKAAGIDVSKMNHRMISNIVRQAKHHHTSIYKYAKKNY